MDFLTATLLSGVVYDFIKRGAELSAGKLRESLRDWIISDEEADAISKGLNTLKLTDEHSERSIERQISESSQLMKLIETIKPVTVNKTIIQSHSGTGDNVGRDKIINK